MKKRVITISREYGSGGRAVGKQVAQRLGVAFYDKELMAKISVESGLDPAFIEEYGEYATTTSRFLYSFEMHSSYPGGSIPVPEQLYVIQHNAILELAEAGPCVIVGRCADYVLKDRADCLHVFLHAPPAFRADRIVREYGETTDAPQKLLEMKDGKRKVYYEHYTSRVWGMARNYHVSLDSSVIGIDRCVEIVARLASE
ncbi:MAG: cytidylate kinase-like family protein [Planctomycetes bacterium]|nr:cytidylate kinase-like family protein [Planctomycetota bacterium]